MLTKVVIFLTCLCLTQSLIKCPIKYLIRPCVCYPDTEEVHCIGNTINDKNLAKIGFHLKYSFNRKFNLLFISNTNITEIKSDLFPIFKFKSIFLNKNINLRTIDTKNMKKGIIKNLIIGNQSNITFT